MSNATGPERNSAMVGTDSKEMRPNSHTGPEEPRPDSPTADDFAIQRHASLSASSTVARSTTSSTHSADESSDAEATDMAPIEPVQSAPPYSAFSQKQKIYIVTMVTIAAFISPTSANIYFPALNPLAKQLDVDNTLINLTLTSYMIFQGLAPTFMGDLSDMAGRRPTYIIAFIIYIGANIGLALQTNYAALFILRCLQSTGSSGAIALSYGTVGDIATSAERGKYAGIVGAGTMLGPAISPVIGGLLSQFLGWRSIFWFLVIFTACWLIPFALTVPETGRNVVGNGSVPPQGWNMTILEWWKLRKQSKNENELTRTVSSTSRRAAQQQLAKGRKLRFPNPLRTIHIIMEKDVGLILFYNALIYTAFYDVVASIPSLYAEIYNFNDLQIGLCYIPFGVGCCVASFTNGRQLDRNYAKVAKNMGFTIDRKRGDDLRNFPIEKARIEIMYPRLILGLVSIICYGWVLEQNANLAFSLILTCIIGFCVNGSFNILNTLLVDLYPQSPATATAANNLVRCLIGAGGTGIIEIMITGMGRGWCFTFIGLVCLVTMPMLLVETKYGPKWREERRVRLEKQQQEKEAKERLNDGGESGENAPDVRIVEKEERERELRGVEGANPAGTAPGAGLDAEAEAERSDSQTVIPSPDDEKKETV